MGENLFDGLSGIPDLGGHHSVDMVTDSHGDLISDVFQGHDATSAFTDSHGTLAGTISHDAQGTHFQNMAGQEIGHIDHGVVYDARNLPSARMFTHGDTTELTDLSGNSIGHVVRTPSGNLIFDGGYPPVQIGSSIDF